MVVEKHWKHVEFIQHITKTVRRAHMEIEAIEERIGDSPTKVEVIMEFLN